MTRLDGHRTWLAQQVLPDDERAAIERRSAELGRLGEDLGVLDKDIAQVAIDEPAVKRLLTITGVNLIVAAGLVAAIGDVRRFDNSEKFVELCRPEPACAAVRPGAGAAWPHQQARPLTRPRHAGGGRLGRLQGGGPVARLLSADPGTAWPPDCSSGDSAKARPCCVGTC